MTVSALSVPAAPTEPGDSVTHENSFDVGMYLGENWKVNLRLAIRRPERITITVKDPGNTVLYRELLRKTTRRYWRKFDFKGSQPGVYQFEISDGCQTIVRQVEVVDMPAIESQRYITHGPQIHP